MIKKTVSVILAAVLICLSFAVLGGCSDGDYPVSVANITIDKQPTKIAVLDPGVADIISYIGYDTTMVARSEDVDQSYMQVVPSVGTQSAPDVNTMIATEASIVFAGEELGDSYKDEIEQRGIPVIRLSQAQNASQLETNYRTLGKILGGAVTGDNKASKAYSGLIEEMEKRKLLAGGSDTLDTVCYLYVENGTLRHVTSGTYGDMLLSYTGAVNVAVNIEESTVDVNTLKVANPNYIFYADEETLKLLQTDATLSKLNAVKGNKMLQITRAEMSRQGMTALETLEKMIFFMHPEKAATPDEAQAVEASATQPATEQPATEAVKSLAADYKIELKEDLTLKHDDENDNVKAMQQRLYDLGYVTDKENVTGYFGDVSEEAVKAFQKASGIEETGEADYATLQKLFMSDAKKKE